MIQDAQKQLDQYVNSKKYCKHETDQNYMNLQRVGINLLRGIFGKCDRTDLDYAIIHLKKSRQ
jgi:hypothetical protein